MSQPSRPDNLRLFIAVELPSTVKDELEKFLERLKRGTQFTGARPTWVAPGNLHLTLAFLGDQPGEHLHLIKACMQQAAQKAPPLKLRLKGVELFPNPKAPKVISIGVQGKVSKLGDVRETLVSLLRQNGFDMEDRPFRPHLTLGRINSAKGVSGLRDIAKSHSTIAAGEFLAPEIVLFQSTLTSDGPIYTALARQPFTSPELEAPAD